MNIQADETLNAVIVRADPADMSEILEIIHNLDVRRTQVLIEAAIVEISLDNTLNYGTDFAGLDTSGNSVPLISTALSPSIAALIKAITGSTDASGNPIVPVAAIGALSSPGVAVARLSTNGFNFAVVLQAIATSTQSQPAVDAEYPDARQRRSENPRRSGSPVQNGHVHDHRERRRQSVHDDSA